MTARYITNRRSSVDHTDYYLYEIVKKQQRYIERLMEEVDILKNELNIDIEFGVNVKSPKYYFHLLPREIIDIIKKMMAD